MSWFGCGPFDSATAAAWAAVLIGLIAATWNGYLRWSQRHDLRRRFASGVTWQWEEQDNNGLQPGSVFWRSRNGPLRQVWVEVLDAHGTLVHQVGPVDEVEPQTGNSMQFDKKFLPVGGTLQLAFMDQAGRYWVRHRDGRLTESRARDRGAVPSTSGGHAYWFPR